MCFVGINNLSDAYLNLNMIVRLLLSPGLPHISSRSLAHTTFNVYSLFLLKLCCIQSYTLGLHLLLSDLWSQMVQCSTTKWTFFVQELKLIFPNSQRINRGGQVYFGHSWKVLVINALVKWYAIGTSVFERLEIFWHYLTWVRCCCDDFLGYIRDSRIMPSCRFQWHNHGSWAPRGTWWPDCVSSSLWSHSLLWSLQRGV